MEIITNNQPRFLKYRYEVPNKILETDFDWCDEDNGFFQYKGEWYHISEFMRINAHDASLRAWDGYANDTYFSGVLIRLSDDGESVICGRFYS